MLRAHPAAPATAAQAARARAPNITFDYNGAAAAEPLARERIADALEDLVQLGADPPDPPAGERIADALEELVQLRAAPPEPPESQAGERIADALEQLVPLVQALVDHFVYGVGQERF